MIARSNGGQASGASGDRARDGITDHGDGVCDFSRATQNNPLEVIKWKEIYETLENAIDRCEDVANVLEGIVLKNA